MDLKIHRILQHLIDGPSGGRGIIVALGVRDISVQGGRLYLDCGDSLLSVVIREVNDIYPARFTISCFVYKDGAEGGLQAVFPSSCERGPQAHNLFRDMVIKLLDKDPYIFN